MLAEPEIYAIRLGYGLSPLVAPVTTTAEYLESVKRAGPDPFAITTAEMNQLEIEFKAQKRLIRSGDKDAEQRAKAIRREFTLSRIGLHQARVGRAVSDPAGFGERLVQFWADHFTVRALSFGMTGYAATFVEEAIRPNIGGKFADLLFASETHPAMLIYLEQIKSYGPNSSIAIKRRNRRQLGLNENLAREMIELHSLGVDAGYTQKDVVQLAELLTGLTYKPQGFQIFDPNMAEPGAETVLGRSYGSDGAASLDDIRAVINDLATHEATARHIAQKLAVHFVADQPPQTMVDRLAGVFRDSGGDLSAVNAALIESPELITHFRQKVRQPYDFIVAGMRALGVTHPMLMRFNLKQVKRTILTPLTTMGQAWSNPRGPDGWPEAGENWATPPGLAARMNWAFEVPETIRRVLPDAREFLATTLGSTASEALQWAVPKAESTREGVAVVLASSDFNRR